MPECLRIGACHRAYSRALRRAFLRGVRTEPSLTNASRARAKSSAAISGSGSSRSRFVMAPSEPVS